MFSFSHSDLLRAFGRVGTFLGLNNFGFVLYCLRHGGPSRDRLSGFRSLPEIQRRGRWASDTSVRRYEQVGRLHVVENALSQDVRLFAKQCQAHIVDLILSPLPLARPRDRQMSISAAQPIKSE